ncbi:MAG: 1-deoxy-D-xylulose-5-phosphate reductoisomerase [Planctomycetaceae bacterium]
MTRIAVLGSTGSIGTSCLDVAAAHAETVCVVGLAAQSRWPLLAEQCRQFRPPLAVLADETLRDQVDRRQFPTETELRFGRDAVQELAAHSDVDTVISAIVGAAGLQGTWSALSAGKTVGLANKESLVVGGPLVMAEAARTGAQLVPVDSEHSAVFQALQCGRREDLFRIILTASGGPFRERSRSELDEVSVESALAHPTWRMGPKITIDSATMMNKALEVIEARWLFDVRRDQIDVVVHPQSVVHSLVEYVDGSILAQMSPPDMRLPIQYALTYPARWPGTSPRLNLCERFALEFEPPDLDRFPALGLGFEVAERGGTCGAVLNAANEVAVRRFLDRTLKFTDISRVCRAVLDAHDFDATPTLDRLLELDRWAREETNRWLV